MQEQEKLLADRLEKAEIMLDQFQQKLSSGEEDKLLFSQSNLQTMALRNEYDRIVTQISINHLALEEISGDKLEQTDLLVFPPSPSIISDSLLKDYDMSAGKQLHLREFELKQQEKRLAQSNYMPKLLAGYYSESVLDQKFKGFQVGITVPLWENVNTMKHAKSEVLFAEAESERFSSNQRKELLQKLDKLQSLISQVNNLEAALSLVNDEELLTLALESGEISLTEYMYSSDLYFRNMQSLLLYKRDRLLLEADHSGVTK